MSGQVIRLAYGKANFSNTYATYAAMKVTAPCQRVTAITTGKRHGNIDTLFPGRHEMNGALRLANVEHEYGTVILLQASWKRKGAPIRDASLFMRLRMGAPLYNVRAYLPRDHENILGEDFVVFSGYADILAADELEQIGIEVGRSYVSKFMETEEVEECFNVTQLQTETVGRPQLTAIITPTGTQLREAPQQAKRRIILRRR